MKKALFIDIVTVSFIILFLYTGISKLMDFSVFKEQLNTSPILRPFSGIIGFGLPIIEFAVTILLVIPKWRLRGLYFSLALMILFTAYIIGILNYNEELPCSCGGIISEMSWTQHLFFNSAFIVLATIAIKLLRGTNKMDSAASKNSSIRNSLIQ